MSKEKDIRDDEIRVIGSDDGQRKKFQGWKWLVLLLLAAVSVHVTFPAKEKIRLGLESSNK